MPEIKHRKKKSSMLTPQGWWDSPIAGKVHFRSSYERRFYAYLDEHRINWKGCKDRFPYISPSDGKEHKYIPDVILTGKDGSELYVEIKGMIRKNDPAKFEAFPEDKKLVLLGCEELKALGLEVFDPIEKSKDNKPLQEGQWPYKLLQNMPDFWERGVLTEECRAKVSADKFLDHKEFYYL